MACFVSHRRFDRLLLLLLNQQSECLKSQIFRWAATTISTSTTTTNTASSAKYVRDKERDETNFHASEGHRANCTYQAPFARLVFSTLTPTKATAITDRPVYCTQHTPNQPPLTHHFRFYCTAKTIRKKMVSHFFFCLIEQTHENMEFFTLFSILKINPFKLLSF